MNDRQLTDEELAARVQGGDTEAFGVLVERYEEKLVRYGRRFLSYREDIEDIVQDVFLSAFENMRSFDASQRFSPWVYRIAHNAYVNALKKRSRNPFVTLDLDTLVSHPIYENPAQKEREQRELREMIDRGLEKLPPKYREILILYYLEEMPYKEIAEVLQVPTGTVGVRLKRAKAALRDAYRKLDLDYGT